jgi:hypothetical protein
VRPLPEKWEGLQDIEARYRERYLDLLTNERSRAVFEKRIAIVRETAAFFEERGFVEVETPILQTMAEVRRPNRSKHLTTLWHRSLSAHCAGALSETFAGGRVQQGVRDQSQLSQRRHLQKTQSGIHDA